MGNTVNYVYTDNYLYSMKYVCCRTNDNASILRTVCVLCCVVIDRGQDK